MTNKRVNPNNRLCVDFLMTTSCNLRCTYCYEEGSVATCFTPDDEVITAFYDRMDELLASDYLKTEFPGGITLNFWGGEPTLNADLVSEITERYKDNDKVVFFMFSNGYNIKPVYNILDTFKSQTVNGQSKFYIQISYDGQKMQDIQRPSAGGKITSKEVRATIDMLGDEQIPFGIKSTVSRDCFNLLPESYIEMREIFENVKNNRHAVNNYFPTIDYYQPPSDPTPYKQALNDALIQIAPHEVAFKSQYNRYFMKWFEQSKRLCAAGKSMIVIDHDGSVYPCHGCLYDKKENHLITNVKNSTNFINTIREKSNEFDAFYRDEPEKCQNCESTFCLRCNVTKFGFSDKKSYGEKWTDHTNQPDLCEYFKMISEVRIAMDNIR